MSIDGSFGVTGAYFQYAPGAPVLQGVDFEIRRGEIHSLVGANGAGKSTLIRVLTGVVHAQLGDLVRDGERVVGGSIGKAQELGIGVVHQHYNLFPRLSIAANLMAAGMQVPRWRLTRTIRRREVRREVGVLLSRLGIDLDPETPVGALDAAEKKLVEVARAMRLTPSYLILDEPTAALEPSASRRVLQLMTRLREHGVGVCFVSHRLDEVLEVSDRLTVLRDGRRIACYGRGLLNLETLAQAIVGERADTARSGKTKSPGEGVSLRVSAPSGSKDLGRAVLRIKRAQLQLGASSVALDVNRGEVLGLMGLTGSGASRLVRMLGGVEPLVGVVESGGRDHEIRQPRDAQKLGVGFIPEDRAHVGYIRALSVATNLALAQLARRGLLRRVNKRSLRTEAERQIESLGIVVSSADARADSLSGGNLQRLLLAKWLLSGMTTLAVEEPTHGVDVEGKARIIETVRTFVADGGRALICSSEPDEALELCHRIGVMRHGSLVEILDPTGTSREDLTAKAASSGVEVS